VVSKDVPYAVANISDGPSTEKLAVLDFSKKEFSILPDSNTYLQSFRVFSPGGKSILFQDTSNQLSVYDIGTKDVEKLKTTNGIYSFLAAQKYFYYYGALPRMFAWVDSEHIVFTCAKEDAGRLQNRNNWAYCILNPDSNSFVVSQDLPNVYKGEIAEYYSLHNGLQKVATWDMNSYDKRTEVPSPDGSEKIFVDYFLRGWDGTTAWKVVWSDNKGNRKDIYRGPIPTGVYWTNDNHVFVTIIGEIRKIK
jgi:hypothetical protein